MTNFTDKFPIGPGDLYEGWIYIGIEEFPLEFGSTTHILFFHRADNPNDHVSITNGQFAAGAQFCVRNGKIDVCPPELVPFAIGTFEHRI
jgi:hypothetical protein